MRLFAKRGLFGTFFEDLLTFVDELKTGFVVTEGQRAIKRVWFGLGRETAAFAIIMSHSVNIGVSTE